MLKALRNFLVTFTIAALLSAMISPAAATESLKVTVAVDGSGTLAGSTVTTPDPSRNYFLTIYTEGALLTRAEGGNSGVVTATLFRNNTRGIHVFGTAAQLNAFLPEISVSRSCGTNYKIYGQLSTHQIMRNPGNGHFYYLNQQGATSFADALIQNSQISFPLNTSGTKGYFGNITNEDEYVFLSSTFNFNLILGATDVAKPGTWVWAAGPEKNKAFYRGQSPTGEPVGNAINYWAPEEPSSANYNNHALIQTGNVWQPISATDDNQLVEFGGFKSNNLKVTIPNSWSESVYKGTPATRLFSGNGSFKSPYQVKTAADIVNTTGCGGEGIFFKQTKNITLPSTYDSSETSMIGFYDGGNKSIQWSKRSSRPTLFDHDDAGVWSVIGYPAPTEDHPEFLGIKSSVKNMNIRGYIDVTDVYYAGLLAGDAYWAKLSNIKVSGSVKLGGECAYLGGLVGYAERVDLDKITSKVSFKGTAWTGNLGGVIGSAELTGTLQRSSWIGSIVVGGTNENDHFGGLIGYARDWNINRNAVKGKITVSDTNYVGGVAGETVGSGTIYANNVAITITDANGDRVGGLAGMSSTQVLENLVTSTGISGGLHVGGLSGIASANVEGNVFYGIKGAVKADQNAGSLAGFVDAPMIGNLAVGKVIAGTTRGAFGSAGTTPSNLQSNFWSPTNAGVAQPDPLWTGENPLAVNLLKKTSSFTGTGVTVSSKWKAQSTWTICGKVNGSYPFPTVVFRSSPCPGKK